MSQSLQISRGESWPLGASVHEGGVNFSLYSATATGVDLLIFGQYDDKEPALVIELNPRHNRSFHYWHVFVHGLGEGTLYGYRVHGPWAPERGHRFDPEKVLIDPYAKGIVYGDNWSRERACLPGDNTASSMKGLVIDETTFDWAGVQPPRVKPTERVIYELHVRGFTRHPSSGVTHPGTFAGLIEMIPYLKDLGITTVELLPVFQFDEHAPTLRDPMTGERLTDYWGYNPIGFFSPHRGYYITDWENMVFTTGFRDLVKAFHRAGIEVFLDVVFNHTAEGGEGGPTMSFRGIENEAYYTLDPNDLSSYANYSGCGNTVSANHPIVRRLILDSLRYWVEVMHVDGFRFDLASILSRNEDGTPTDAPPLTWEIESDPTLQRASLIAEAWDAAGLYQVGAFPGERWSEWNGQFRDDVRRFVRGDEGLAGTVATRMMGSPDLYQHRGHQPSQCINFITAHDGFTLADLVSYEHKHNERNGESNRDGANDNFSSNHGIEGPTDEPHIQRLRTQQMKNLLAILFLSQGTPMMLAGDEFGNSQNGNNNVWCQDNETGWLDWSDLHDNPDYFRFVRRLIHFRHDHPSLHRSRYLLGVDAPQALDPPGYTRVAWHGRHAFKPDWSSSSRFVSFTLTEAVDDRALHIIVNMAEHPVTVILPPAPQQGMWCRVMDTSLPSPEDIVEPGDERIVISPHYQVNARSVVALLNRRAREFARGLTGRIHKVPHLPPPEME